MLKEDLTRMVCRILHTIDKQLNDKISLTDFEITNRVKSLKFYISEKDKPLTITLIATDEGTIPLTTVKAVLRNGNESNLLNTSMNKGQSVKITFQKE